MIDTTDMTVAQAEARISLLCEEVYNNEEEIRFMQDEIDRLDKFIEEQPNEQD